jgi:flagellar protein FlaF
VNALHLAKTAYSANRAPIRTDRGTEYEAFAKITHRLKMAAQQNRIGFAALAQALHENRRLWTILAADVAEPGNSLPGDLRARIFYLAEFTAQYSSKVLTEGADPDVLVDINTAVMRGLRQKASLE